MAKSSKTVKNVAAAAELAAVDAAAVARVEALQAAAKAEENKTLALIGAVLCTVTNGAYTAEEVAAHFVTGSSVAVYRSNFNLGHKAAQVIGEARTLKVIEQAATVAGKKYDNVLDALRAVVAAGKASGGEAQPAKVAAQTVKAAVLAAAEGSAKREEAKAARRGPRAPKTEAAPAADSAEFARPRRVAAAMAKASAGFAPFAEALRVLRRDAEMLGADLESEAAKASLAFMLEALESCAATADMLAK